ncbi:hypothetical protein ABIB48_002466 [Arthrobacter sp. UYCu511]|uniref:hypothetical protein n=1 Tax=Arthrobacter sp. UYCu511 TaxID=3156337 RepID=UPI00339517BE
MPADTTFYAPVGYSAWWPLLGVALLILCAAAVAWIWVATKPPGTIGVPNFVPPRHPQGVKAKYLALIDGLQNQHDAGHLATRAAHSELSLAVRTFVHEMTGLRTQRMTLTELREHRLPLAEEAVELFYPGEFSRTGGDRLVSDSAQAARNVVREWR